MTLHCRRNKPRRRRGLRGLLAVTLLAAGTAPVAGQGDADKALAIKAAVVHLGDGRTVEGGVIVMRGGRIAAVGSGVEIPADATVIDITGASVTPGLIDANVAVDSYDLMPTPTLSLGHAPPPGVAAASEVEIEGGDEGGHGSAGDHTHAHVHSADPATVTAGVGFGYLSADAHVEAGYDHSSCLMCGGALVHDELTSAAGVRVGLSQTEHAAEVIPHTRALDAIDLNAPDFSRLLSQGVTTVYVGGDPGAVISSRGAILRTGGDVASRVVKPESAVRGVMGSDSYRVGAGNRLPFRGPASMYTRRPTTRMGVAWVFRKAFYDAQRWADGVGIHGADAPPEEAMPYLIGVLKGEIPLRIQARMQHDIETALRLSDELGLSFTLEEGTQAYECLDALKDRGVPVVFGPIYEQAPGRRGWSGEAAGARLHTFKALLDAGIETALSAQELRDEDGLARQAMYARRFGAELDDVVRSVTATPAKLLGIEGDTGTIEAGKRADVIVWSGAPFAATSRPVVVVVGGRVQVDRRPG
ncbi:MAG: Imidazolonepropionase [Phycisphaerae bacterium]|nr:Imidazolonepropionase [Phycisphaerae bacterium]